MDAVAPLKNDVFRPLVSLVVPGAVAIAPWTHLAISHVQGVEDFWKQHDAAFVALLVLTVLTVGLILEGVGALVESAVFDAILAKKRARHVADWKAYLQLKMGDEFVGQRYLRTMVTRLKFELPMVPALISFTIGLVRVQQLDNTFSHAGFPYAVAGLIALTIYLLSEAWMSAKHLSTLREWILEGCAREPRSADLSPKT